MTNEFNKVLWSKLLKLDNKSLLLRREIFLLQLEKKKLDTSIKRKRLEQLALKLQKTRLINREARKSDEKVSQGVP